MDPSANLSLLGAVAAPTRQAAVIGAFELLAIVAGVIAVAALLHGAVLLIQETRMAVGILQERVASTRALAAGK